MLRIRSDRFGFDIQRCKPGSKTFRTVARVHYVKRFEPIVTVVDGHLDYRLEPIPGAPDIDFLALSQTGTGREYGQVVGEPLAIHPASDETEFDEAKVSLAAFARAYFDDSFEPSDTISVTTI